MSKFCNREWLIRYLSDKLVLDEKLEYLFHLDECAHCWEAVYNATKAKHPHFYKMSARQLKLSEKELSSLESSESGQGEVFEVA